MYKAELELEKRLNDIALASVPSTSYENIVVVPRFKHHTPLEMSPDEFDLRDLMIDQKMNVISTNAIVNKLGWKPSKIKSDVTKEMIADFQLEQMANIKRGVYVPPALDLDLLELPEPPEDVIAPEDLEAARRDLSRAIAENTQSEKLLAKLPQDRDDWLRKWELKRVLDLDRTIRTFPNIRQRQRRQEEIQRQSDEALDEFNRTKWPEYVAYLERSYTDSKAAIEGITQLIQENQGKQSEYLRQVSEVQDENARRRRIYEDEVRTMNQGMNFVAMLPDETSDQYKERLRAIGDSTSNLDAVETAAALLYSDRLREKMVEITRDEVLTGDFIRRLSTDERYSLIKMWETFKKRVLEIFGVNNKFMSSNDLTNIAEELADVVAAEALAEPVQFKEDDLRASQPLRAFVVEEGDDPEVDAPSIVLPSSPRGAIRQPFTAVSVTETREPFTLLPESLIPKRFREDRKANLIAYANGGPLPRVAVLTQPDNQDLYKREVGRAKKYRKETAMLQKLAESKVVESPTRASLGGTEARSPRVVDLTPAEPTLPEATLPELQVAVQAMASDLADEDQKDRLLAVLVDPATGQPRSKESLVKVLKTSGVYQDVVARIVQVGRGLRGMSIKYPKIVPFGLIEVSPHKLFYENILKITRKGKHLTGFPNVKVSNDFVSFLFKILDGGQPTLKDVNKLSVGEKQLFDSVVFTAGLQKKVEDTGSGVKQKFKDRLALIEGEIEAGNTSDELIKEARQILQHLARMKVIGHRAASGHLKQLINVQRG